MPNTDGNNHERQQRRAPRPINEQSLPCFTWTGLTQAGWPDTATASARTPAATTASQHLSMEIRRPVDLGYGLELWAGGPSPTRRAGAVGCFLGFPLIQTDSSSSPPASHERLTLIALARWRTKIASVAPIAVAYPRRSLSERAPLTLVLAMLRPVKPFARPPWYFFLPTQTNHQLLPNHQLDGTLKHALPPSLTVLFSPRALLACASSPQLLEQGHLNRAHFTAIVVSQASHQQSHPITLPATRNMARSICHATKWLHKA